MDILSTDSFPDTPSDPPPLLRGDGSNSGPILPYGLIVKKGEERQQPLDNTKRTTLAGRSKKRPRRETSKERSESGSGEAQDGSRKRGRPKADTGDETAAEVSEQPTRLLILSLQPALSNTKRTLRSDDAPRYDSRNGHIDSGKRQRLPRSVGA